MQIVIQVADALEPYRKSIVNHVKASLADFLSDFESSSAMLVVSVDVVSMESHQDEVSLSFSSKYYSYTDVCVAESYLTAIDEVCSKLIKEKKRIKCFVQKELHSDR